MWLNLAEITVKYIALSDGENWYWVLWREIEEITTSFQAYWVRTWNKYFFWENFMMYLLFIQNINLRLQRNLDIFQYGIKIIGSYYYYSDAEEVAGLPDKIEYIKPKPNDDYINKIRKNLEENAAARGEREKRRRKVLVDQMKAHEAQEVCIFPGILKQLIPWISDFSILKWVFPQNQLRRNLNFMKFMNWHGK